MGRVFDALLNGTRISLVILPTFQASRFHSALFSYTIEAVTGEALNDSSSAPNGSTSIGRFLNSLTLYTSYFRKCGLVPEERK
ncbi:hypothetical protein AVEN_240784-1, partial [Araneus ventricosus]